MEPLAGGNGERCGACGGLWLRSSEFNELIVDLDRQHAVLDVEPSDTPAVHVDGYVCCPSCGEVMTRQILWRRSGVLVDSCRRHGIWFDRGELRRALEFFATRAHDPAEVQKPVKRAPRRRPPPVPVLIDDPRDSGWLIQTLKALFAARSNTR